jgi:hypothetical protein
MASVNILYSNRFKVLNLWRVLVSRGEVMMVYISLSFSMFRADRLRFFYCYYLRDLEKKGGRTELRGLCYASYEKRRGANQEGVNHNGTGELKFNLGGVVD